MSRLRFGFRNYITAEEKEKRKQEVLKHNFVSHNAKEAVIEYFAVFKSLPRYATWISLGVIVVMQYEFGYGEVAAALTVGWVIGAIAGSITASAIKNKVRIVN